MKRYILILLFLFSFSFADYDLLPYFIKYEITQHKINRTKVSKIRFGHDWKLVFDRYIDDYNLKNALTAYKLTIQF